MKSLEYSGTTWSSNIDDSSVIEGLVTSSGTIGALLGSVVVFPIANIIGRKKELQFGSLLYILGAILMYFSGTSSFSPSLGITSICIGRCIYGLGIGFSMHGAPTYIAEMSPPNIRGLLISLKEAMIVLGILAGYLIGFLLEDTVSGWTYMYGCSICLSSVMFLGTFLLPRSVRWLLLTNNENGDNLDEAVESFTWVFNTNEDVVEGDTISAFNIMKDQAEEQRLQESSTNDDETSLLNKKWRGPLIAGVGLVFLQQVTGQPSILSYATPILDDAGLESYSSVLIGVFKFFATMFAVATVEKHGRKKLLFIGNTLMFLALVVLSVSFFFAGDDSDSTGDDDDKKKTVGAYQITVLGAMFTYIGGYQVGFGPIAWLMISEVFPLKVRGQAVAVAVQMNFFWNSVVQFSVPVIQDTIGNFPLFSIFAVLCAYSIFFVKHYVPETKGLTLEEIEKFFENEEKLSNKNRSNSISAPLMANVV